MVNFLDQVESQATEAEELAGSRSHGVVTKVTLTTGWHGIIGKSLFDEKGEPYNYKLSWVEITDNVPSKDAQAASKSIMSDMGSNSRPKYGMRVWLSRADVMGFDATEGGTKKADFYRDDIVYKPDQVQINGQWTNIHEGYDQMVKSLAPFGEMIALGKPFWAHVITFPVSHNGQYVKLYDGSTMTVPYFMAVFKNKQEATRYQAKLDADEIELPQWSVNAEKADGSANDVNIVLSEKAQSEYTPASFLKTFPTIVSAIVKNIGNGDESNAAIEKACNIFECEQSDIMGVLMLDEFEADRAKVFPEDEEPI